MNLGTFDKLTKSGLADDATCNAIRSAIKAADWTLSILVMNGKGICPCCDRDDYEHAPDCPLWDYRRKLTPSEETELFEE